MAKTPRLDPYLRLMYRLYEALYLLDILGRVRGPHHFTNLDFSTLFAVRRRFLKNIAFLCDYTKGGPTSTAVAIEDGQDCNTFWIASNEGPEEAVISFVTSMISKAKALHKNPDDQKISAEVDLASLCVDFASSRIKKQSHGLSSSARICRQFIMDAMPDQQALEAWLRRFEYYDYEDLKEICQSAYEARKDPEMDALLGLSGGLSEAVVPVKVAALFRKVRHLIARIAAHIRTVKEVIEDIRHMEDLLDGFEVAVVPKPDCVPRLQADGHTNLGGILKRMLRSEDRRLPVFLEYLSDLDEQTGLERQVQDRFDPCKTSPCVHAEIQMLHHFYNSGRRFFADDNYIATSKPACFACKSYFRHHPANYVEPDSHEKVYPNWGPIRLAEGPKKKDDPTWIEHRKVIQDVINDLSREVLNEIERRRRLPFYQDHPDSMTGLTASSYAGALSDDSSDSQDEISSDSNESESESETDTDSTGGAGI